MDELFGKIQISQTLSQKIERKIEEAIRQKKLVAGAKLPSEKELCESFAVSRTALREALRRLSARGLIVIRKGSGMIVSEIKIEDAINSLNLYYDLKFDANLITQIIEVRRLFEPEIARLASRNRMEPIYSLLPRMRNLIYANVEGEKEYTLRLQQCILDAVEVQDDQKAYQYSVELLERNMEVYVKYFKSFL